MLIGLYLIKRGRVEAHKRTMLTAFAVSAVFLALLLVVSLSGRQRRVHAPGAVRYVYYTILASHVLLAITVPFLAICQIYLGFRRWAAARRPGTRPSNSPSPPPTAQKHIRLARWTFPIWLYVSVTGVIVYVMLYHLWPPAAE